MQHTIIIESLLIYFKNSFNFTGQTERKHYWWALSFIYILTIGLSQITALLQIPEVVMIWLALNIIPLVSLTVRRLRDIGLTTLSIIVLFISIIVTALGVILFQSRLAATMLQLIVLLTVLAPLLKTNELSTNKVSLFLRPNH